MESENLLKGMSEWTMKPISCLCVVLSLSYVSLTMCWLADDIKTEIVELHNSLRRSFAQGSHEVFVANMKKLIWNCSLEREARRSLQAFCRPPYNSISDNDMFSNLARTSLGNFTYDIYSWYQELENGFLPEHQDCHPLNNCWHAKSMLNALHRNIGCAYRRRCRDGPGAFLCIYENNDPHNEETLTVTNFYTPGQVCTQCPHPTGFCEDGLCSKCDIKHQLCDCRKTCYTPGKGLGVLDNVTCSCTCQYGRGLNCDKGCDNEAAGHYVDMDICDMVTPEECTDPLVQQFCTAKCNKCRRFPEILNIGN